MSKVPLVHVTIPVKNRAWALPTVLTGLLFGEHPLSRMLITAIDDASSDTTVAVLEAFRADYGRSFAGMEIVRLSEALDDATCSRDTVDRPAGFPHLAALRNQAIDAVLASGADYQLSLDSDILPGPSLVTGLLSHGKDYCASLIFNDVREYGYIGHPLTRRASNAWQARYGGYFRNHPAYPLQALLPIDISGAVYLASQSALRSGARFSADRNGEDVAYCLALNVLGVERWIDTTLRAVHVMTSDRLRESIAVYYAWFGRYLGDLADALIPTKRRAEAGASAVTIGEPLQSKTRRLTDEGAA